MAAANYFETVQKIYIAFYQRPADPAGLTYWANRIDVAGGDASAVIAEFANSPEANALYGEINADTIGDVVDAIYMALFNRAPDAAGKQFYVDEFNAGRMDAGTIALNVLDGAQNDDQVAINNKVQVANEFTQQVDGRPLSDPYFGTGSSFDATYEGDADAVAARDLLKDVTSNPATVLSPSQVTEAIKTSIADAGDPIMGQTGGQTYMLTTGVDSGAAFTGGAGNDTFEAGLSGTAGAETQTLGSFDELNGGGGVNTLNATLNGSAAVSPYLTNIQNVNVRSLANGTVSLTNATGVETVTVANSFGNTTTVNAVGAVKNFAVNNQTGNVTVTGNTATDLNLSFNKFGTAGAASTFTAATGATSATVKLADSNVNVAGVASLTTLAVAATGANTLKTASAGAVETITVTGAGSVKFDDALSVLKSLTSGDGAITADITNATAGAVTVKTGAGADNITAAGAGVASISTGAGNDNVTITGALAATATIALGAGDDRLVLDTAPGAGVTLSGGDGMDTLATTKAVYGGVSGFAADKLANISGFEVLEITDGIAAGDAIDVSKIAGITSFVSSGGVDLVAGTPGDATISGLASGASVTLAGTQTHGTANYLNLQVKDAATGTADVLTVNLNTENAAVRLNTAGVETLNINATGSVAGTVSAMSIGSLVDADLVTLNISGNDTLTVSGTAAMTKLATIDASANTAGVVLDTFAVAQSVTITGTAADDTITLGKGDVLDAGAGDDTITLANLAQVTGGAGEDTFVLTQSANQVSYASIQDFSTADDVIQVFHTATGNETFNKTKITLASNAVFSDFVEVASSGTATNGIVSWFQFNGNTYLVQDNSAATNFVNGEDTIVEIVGLVDFSQATLTGHNLAFA